MNEWHRFIPVPHFLGGDRFDGMWQTMPPTCTKCPERRCLAAPHANTALICARGFAFARVNDFLVLAGLALSDYQVRSQAQKKVRRRLRGHLITSKQLGSLIGSLRDFAAVADQESATMRQSAIADYYAAKQYSTDLLEQMRPDIQRGFSYVHDYRQFISQVSQHMNVILENRYPSLPGEGIDSSLKKALPSEKAIYWAARLMEAKLESALFLMFPDRITDPTRFTRFQFHKLVTKYLRIYEAAQASKNLSVKTIGESYGSLRANGEAVAIIPHTFIDNAFKYAPRDSTVTVEFDEDGECIEFSVSSFGPLIAPSETDLIFEPFKRGAAAMKVQEEGMGFGLYLARVIARALDTDIDVRQDPGRRNGNCYWTTFAVRFERD